MSVWYRAHQISETSEVFSGDGGLYASGRWHRKGRKCVYCSSSIALATLEWLSHHGLSVSGFSYYRYSIEVPDELLSRLEDKDLPTDWKAVPATDRSRDISEKILFKKSPSLGLIVPSVIVPEESNLLLNVLHPEYRSILESVRELGRYQAPQR